MVNIDPISTESISRAVDILQAGQLVAFPTETVYGLGGDATNNRAVAEIFATKNRPEFNPLIIHVANKTAAEKIGQFTRIAHTLADQFWPGALTLVLQKTSNCTIPLLASGGLDSLAIRVPGHDFARYLIEQTGHPIAAPSANTSGRLSPTTAQHVADQLSDKIPLILDGGPCTIGVESTVLDLTGDTPTLLRPGGISVEIIEKSLSIEISTSAHKGGTFKSPGMLTSHYAPARPLRLNAHKAKPGEALLGFGPNDMNANLNLSESSDLTEAAANLFAYLHQLDVAPYRAIAVMPLPEKELGRAINDRLRRAAA
ncbi:MAG: threonylcarbamoyl-AMP synthase [Rhodospirillaceae bacterium]|nr:threonylcarbamoyl-AMP synthase [Rhodospirillaceae bacterium]